MSSEKFSSRASELEDADDSAEEEVSGYERLKNKIRRLNGGAWRDEAGGDAFELRRENGALMTACESECELASLNSSMTSFSDSRFHEYLNKYTVGVSDFEKYFATPSTKNNNKSRQRTNVAENNYKNNINNNSDDDDIDGSSTSSKEAQSETESVLEEKVERATRTLHEIFVEGCCALYSDLRDFLDDIERAAANTTKKSTTTTKATVPPAGAITSNEFHDNVTRIVIEDRSRVTYGDYYYGGISECDLCELSERYRVLMRQAEQLVENVPQLADTVQLRLATLERTMQQLKIRHQQQQERELNENAEGAERPYAANREFGATAPSQRFRKWLQVSESELNALKRRVNDASDDLPFLQRLRADHQVLQLQIETEGRALLNSAYQQLHVERQTFDYLPDAKQLTAENSADNNTTVAIFGKTKKRLDRWQRNLEVLEHRWYTHWLASLEGLELVGRLVDRLAQSEHNSSCSSESDSDGEEPLCKRLRSTATPVRFYTFNNDKAKNTRSAVLQRQNSSTITTTVENEFTVLKDSLTSDYRNKPHKKERTDMIMDESSNLENKLRRPASHKTATVMSGSSGIEEDAVSDLLTATNSDAEFEGKTVAMMSKKHRTAPSATNTVAGRQTQTNNIVAPEQKTLIAITVEEECSASSSSPSIFSSGARCATTNDGGTFSSDGVGSSRSSSSTSSISASSSAAPASHDVGYSSGENNSLLEGGANAQQRTGVTTRFGDNNSVVNNNFVDESIVKSYYRTVPLDDAGVTDTEFSHLLAPSLLPHNNANRSHLTDSLIVQVDNNNLFNQQQNQSDANKNTNNNDSSRPLDDFEEVMEIMDEQFQVQLELLRRGTQWRELRASSGSNVARRHMSGGSGTPRLPKAAQKYSPLTGARSTAAAALPLKVVAGSCDASSEESDNNRQFAAKFRNARSLTSSLCCATTEFSTGANVVTTAAATTTTTSNLDAAVTIERRADSQRFEAEFLPSRRKRYHRRSAQNPGSKANQSGHNGIGPTTVIVPVPITNIVTVHSSSRVNAKLENILMDQSVYVTGNSESDGEKSSCNQTTLNADTTNTLEAYEAQSPFAALRRSADYGRRKAARRRMHRSVSDSTALCDVLQSGKDYPNAAAASEMSNSNYEKHRHHHHHHHHRYHFHDDAANHQRQLCASPRCHQCEKAAFAKQQGKCRKILSRTCSMESCQSSASSTSSAATIHESGDAHFEWDEYRDLCNLLMPPSCTDFEDGIYANGQNKHSTPKRSPSNLPAAPIPSEENASANGIVMQATLLLHNSSDASTSILDPESTSIVSAEDEEFFNGESMNDYHSHSDSSGTDVEEVDCANSRNNSIVLRSAKKNAEEPTLGYVGTTNGFEAHRKLSRTILDTQLDESRASLQFVERLIKSARANFIARKRREGKRGAKISSEKLALAHSTAVDNLQRLTATVNTSSPAHINMKQISEVEKLREEWRQILSKISQKNHKMRNNNKTTNDNKTKDENNKKKSNNKNNDNNNGAASDEETVDNTVSLHGVLEEMKVQLSRLILCDNNANVPLSIQEVEEVVLTRKEILRSLINYRDDLRDLTAEAQRRAAVHCNSSDAISCANSTDAFERADVLELMALVDLVETSLYSIQSSTVSLEKLREDFSALWALLLSLSAKIDRLASSLPSESNLQFSDSADDTMQIAAFAKVIESELALCQERMDALETVCNTLSSNLSLTRSFTNERAILSAAPAASDASCNTAPGTMPDEIIPAEPFPSISSSIPPTDVPSSNAPAFKLFTEFSQFRDELKRLKIRFQNAVDLRESQIGANLGGYSPGGSPTSSRKRRLKGDSSHSSTSIGSTETMEQLANCCSPIVSGTPTMVATIGTQSEISAETFRNYEARLSAARSARRAARIAKLSAQKMTEENGKIDFGAETTVISKTVAKSPNTVVEEKFGVSKRKRVTVVDTPKSQLRLRSTSASPQRFSQRFRVALRDSRLAQLCLGCTLLLSVGMLLLQLFSAHDERNPLLVNNYRWSFGPQLDYVRGPPPH